MLLTKFILTLTTTVALTISATRRPLVALATIQPVASETDQVVVVGAAVAAAANNRTARKGHHLLGLKR